MLVVVALHRAVSRLVLVHAVGRYQHGGHHGERAERGRHHIAHHVAIVVLAGPDEAALGLHHARHGVVDQRVEVLDAGLVEARLILGIEDFLEDVLEAMIVLLGDGVLGGEPHVLMRIERIVEAAAREAFDRRIQVVHALHDARAVEFMHQLALLGTVGRGIDQLDLAGAGNTHLGVLVHVAVRMAGQRDGSLPVAHARLDAAHHDRGAEHRAVEHGADGAVGALPHLLEAVFLHTSGVGGDRRALHGDAEALGRFGRFDRHGVVGLVAMLEAEVVVLGLQVDERADQLVFDHLPDNAGHLVAVHLNQRRGHLNLRHGPPFFSIHRTRKALVAGTAPEASLLLHAKA